jgi:hypothetical protein
LWTAGTPAIVIDLGSLLPEPNPAPGDTNVYTVNVPGVVYADTIVAHLQTTVTCGDYDPADKISFFVYGETPGQAVVNFEYSTGNSNNQDVGLLHDSIYITPVPVEIQIIEITLDAEGCYPLILDGSWIELKEGDNEYRVTKKQDTYERYPLDRQFAPKYDMLGQIGQGWTIANGMGLGERSQLKFYNAKQFSPLDTVSEKRKADIHLGVSWIGTADVNGVDIGGYGTNYANWGYEIAVGVSAGFPPARIIAGDILATSGELSPGFDLAVSVADSIRAEIQDQLIDDMAEDAVTDNIPYLDMFLAVVEFLIQIATVDEKFEGSDLIKFQDVPRNSNDRHFVWIGLAQEAVAVGTGTSYVNFMFSGDPFFPDPTVKANHYQKGTWLHHVIVYYQPVRLSQITMDKPEEQIYDPNTIIPLSARVEKGTAPYIIEWTASTKAIDGTITDVQSLGGSPSTWSTDTDVSQTLEAGTYLITVQVTDEEGSTDTDSWNVTVLGPPGTPTVSIDPTRVETMEWYTVNWNAVPGATSYEVEESKDGGPWFTHPPQTWLYNHFITADYGQYSYKVSAVDDLDHSATSAPPITIIVDPAHIDALVMRGPPARVATGVDYGVNWEWGPQAVNGYVLWEYTHDASLNRIQTAEVDFPGCPNLMGELCRTDPIFNHDEDETTWYEYEVAAKLANGLPGSVSNVEGTHIYPAPDLVPVISTTPNSVGVGARYRVSWVDDNLDADSYCWKEYTSDPNSPVDEACTSVTSLMRFKSPSVTTTYNYRVRAKNNAGSTAWSEAASKTVYYGTAPGIPVISASETLVDPNQVYTIGWPRVEAEWGYQLQEATNPSFSGALDYYYYPTPSPPANSEVFSHAQLGLTDYYYRVIGLSTQGNSAPSDTISVRVIGTDSPPPPALHDPGGTVLPGRDFTISWTPVDGAVSYQLQANTDPTFAALWTPGDYPSTSATSMVIDHPASLFPDTTNLYYRVRVFSHVAGKSTWSKIIMKQIYEPDCAAMGLTAPPTPTNLRAEPPTVLADEEFVIRWDPAPHAVEYEVGRDHGVLGLWGCDGWIDRYLGPDTSILQSEPMDYSVSGDDEKGVCYWVKAWNNCGGSPLSAPLNVKCVTYALDSDGDGFGNPATAQVSCVDIPGRVRQAGDCDDGDPETYPGAPQVCDGKNTDCNDPVWPALSGDEWDDDGDTFTECNGDCDDTYPLAGPGAPEINDGVDNQCPGDRGFGLVDELEVLGFFNPNDPDELSWAPQPAAFGYDVAQLDSPLFTGNCQRTFTSGTTLSTAAPVEISYYVARAAAAHMGSWGADSAGDRSLICDDEQLCDDNADNDGDGLIDCDDPDCGVQWFCPRIFTFMDTVHDDLEETALLDFFTTIDLFEDEYMLFEIQRGAETFAWCAEQADEYVSQYLTMAGTAGDSWVSGPWNKWVHEPLGWAGPTTESFTNLYTGFAWISELEILNGLTIIPEDEANCEAHMAAPELCGEGFWRLTIRIAATRDEACGF